MKVTKKIDLRISHHMEKICNCVVIGVKYLFK